MKLVLGIDIGVQGAIALFDENSNLISVTDMPVLADDPKGRRAINAPLLASIIFKSHATHAFVDHVGARPGEGAVGGFAFGRARGIVEGVLAAAGIPASFITPACWKRIVGLPSGRDKDASRSAAISRWPTSADLFKLKGSDGLAEAALVAAAGLVRKGKV
jgi:hypothetical protein